MKTILNNVIIILEGLLGTAEKEGEDAEAEGSEEKKTA